jgi:hypothetical protein
MFPLIARTIFATFLLLLSGASGILILVFGINPTAAKARAQPHFGILWALFIFSGVFGLILLRVIPLLPK